MNVLGRLAAAHRTSGTRSRHGTSVLLLACGLALAGCSPTLASDARPEICGGAEALQAALENLLAGTGEPTTDVTYAVARAQDLLATIDNASEAESRKLESALDDFLGKLSPSVLAMAGPAFTLPTSTSIPLPSPTSTAATTEEPTSEDLDQVKQAAEPLEESVTSELDRLGC